MCVNHAWAYMSQPEIGLHDLVHLVLWGGNTDESLWESHTNQLQRNKHDGSGLILQSLKKKHAVMGNHSPGVSPLRVSQIEHLSPIAWRSFMMHTHQPLSLRVTLLEALFNVEDIWTIANQCGKKVHFEIQVYIYIYI